MDAWGFRYKSNLAWIKETPRLGAGNFWRNAHELLLLGVRGDAGRFLDRTLKSILEAPPGRHSEEPEAARAMIERAVPVPLLRCSPAHGERGGMSYGRTEQS
jgi:N6-adenosine-specific RNA methylase IME4